jgi:hypothetical protein
MVCVGSVVGAVAWGSNMQRLAFFYEAQVRVGVIPQQGYTLYASSFRFAAVFTILNGVEFCCLIICKLMLLGRLVTSATQSSQADVTDMSGVRRRWLSGWALPNVYRVTAGAVVVGGVVGMVANVVAAAYADQVARLHDQAAAACDSAGKDTTKSLEYKRLTSKVQSSANSAQSIQFMSEAVTLLLVSLAFVAIVSWSVVIFRMVERFANRALAALPNHNSQARDEVKLEGIVNDTMHAAAVQRQRLIAACIIVLLTASTRSKS